MDKKTRFRFFGFEYLERHVQIAISKNWSEKNIKKFNVLTLTLRNSLLYNYHEGGNTT